MREVVASGAADAKETHFSADGGSVTAAVVLAGAPIASTPMFPGSFSGICGESSPNIRESCNGEAKLALDMGELAVTGKFPCLDC